MATSITTALVLLCFFLYYRFDLLRLCVWSWFFYNYNFSGETFGGKDKESWELISTVINCLAVVMILFSLILIIFPFNVAQIIAPGFSHERLELTAHIIRLVSVNPLLLAVATIFSHVQQALQKFLFVALAPMFYNLSIILSIYLFKDGFGVVGLGVGVAIGSVMSFIFLAIGLRNLNFRYWPIFKIRNPHFIKLIKLGFGYMLGLLLLMSYKVILLRYLTIVSTHAVSNFTNALAILAIFETIGMAYGQATMPSLVSLANQNLDKFRSSFRHIFVMTCWVTGVAIIIGYFGRNYIASFLFRRDYLEIAFIFGIICLTILSRNLLPIIRRYYSIKKTIIQIFIGRLIGFCLAVGLIVYFAELTSLGLVGLLIADVLAIVLETAFLIFTIVRNDRQIFSWSLFRRLGLVGLAGLATSGITWTFLQLIPWTINDGRLVLFGKLLALSVVVIVSYDLISKRLGLSETDRVKAYILSVLKLKTKKV